MSSLDRIKGILDRMVDAGSRYVQVLHWDVLNDRLIQWKDGHYHWSKNSHDGIWAIRALYTRFWYVQRSRGFAELDLEVPRMIKMMQDTDKNINGWGATQAKEVMVSKPVRHSYYEFNKEPASRLSQDKEVESWIGEIGDFLPRAANLAYKDKQIKFACWDTDNAQSTREYVRAEMKVLSPRGAKEPALMNFRRYHFEEREEKMNPAKLNWQEEVRRWCKDGELESFKGASPEQLNWLYTPHAFAKLIQSTLGPLLCQERPEPFQTAMNPASMEGKALTPACFSLSSSPSLVSDKPFVDHEGVPARRLKLVDAGILQEFLLTRSSASHLGRSLSIRNPKQLGGSSLLYWQDGDLHPEMLHLEVEGGQGLSDASQKAHVLIKDLEVSSANSNGNAFLISVKNSVVMKFGGLHQRQLPLMTFWVDRDTLWQRLVSLGAESELVALPVPGERDGLEPLALFKVPYAEFLGAPCRWS